MMLRISKQLCYGNWDFKYGEKEMKVLITGATGFIGTKLVRALAEKGDEIRALVFPGEDSSGIQEYAAEIREGDITRPQTLAGLGDSIDLVYHLAARVLDYGTREQFYEPILAGTKNMLEVCDDRVERFVFASSICACGTGRHMKGMTEKDPCRRTGIFYGDAKLEAEDAVKSYASRFPKGYVIVRPANVIGPGSVWVAELGRMFQEKLVPLIEQGRYSASLVYIDNLVDGLVLAGTSQRASCQTYFFRDDWEVTWKAYLTDLSAMVGKKPGFSLPYRLAWALGFLAEAISLPLGMRPSITRHAVGLMGRDNDVDSTKARAELGWETRITYEQAKKEIRAWVEQNML